MKLKVMKNNDMNNLVTVILHPLKAEQFVTVLKPNGDQQPPEIQVTWALL